MMKTKTREGGRLDLTHHALDEVRGFALGVLLAALEERPPLTRTVDSWRSVALSLARALDPGTNPRLRAGPRERQRGAQIEGVGPGGSRRVLIVYSITSAAELAIEALERPGKVLVLARRDAYLGSIAYRLLGWADRAPIERIDARMMYPWEPIDDEVKTVVIHNRFFGERVGGL